MTSTPPASDDVQTTSRRTFMATSAAALSALAASSYANQTPASTAMEGGRRAPAAPPVFPRRPLATVPYVALPLGSVRPLGWALKQLELQKNGLTGYADVVLPNLTRASSAWLSGGNGEDWEKGPYYAKGLVSLAYSLNDQQLIAKAQPWVEAILGSQRDDGFYGPQNDDWWPRMVVNYMLRDYAEATGDERVVPFLSKYYRHMRRTLPDRPLQDWGKARAGDEIDTTFWLYNRTGDESLLALADLLYEQAYPWRSIFSKNLFIDPSRPVADFFPKHSVNVAQALKAPAIYWQRSGDKADRDAYREAIRNLAVDHGASFGLNTGTEMVSGRSTVEGVELCAIVENLLSAATALRILGDAQIGDELEMTAFNALPAAMSKDLRQHVYYTLANNVSSRRGEVGYEVDYDDARTLAPHSGFPCCCYNLHMGWPKLVQNAWAASTAGGLALLTYVPSEATTQVAGGAVVRATCETKYPFEETISLSLHVDRPAAFPLSLRIPGWCQAPVVKVNGEPQPGIALGTFATVEREWSAGDRVELQFPMTTTLAPGVVETVSVRRGPLVYALGLEEHWTALERGNVPGFDSYEVTTSAAWNYGLVLNSEQGGSSLAFESRPMSENPFAAKTAPNVIKARARRITDWKSRPDGLLALDPPLSPIDSEQGLETLELVPFSTPFLRITDFPVVGTREEPRQSWACDFEQGLDPAWIAYRGGTVREQRLHLPHGAKAVATDTHFADLTFEGVVNVGADGDAGIMFRVSDASIGPDHYKGYYAGIDAGHAIALIGKSDYMWAPLARGPFMAAADRDYRLKIVARGNVIELWIDDGSEPVLSVRDDSFASGMIGVRSFANRSSFRGLLAKSI